MAKKKGKTKATKPVELSKKERKALKAREAELLAELEAAKTAKKAKKAGKGKTPKPADIDPVVTVEVPSKTEHSPAAIIEAADKVLADKNASEGALKSARAAKSKALELLPDADLKARVKAKAKRRLELESDDYRAAVDRDDDDAVKAYNAEAAELGLGHFLTSSAELKKAVKGTKGKKLPKLAGPADDTETTEAVAADPDEARVPDTASAAQEAVEVETDRGREFAVGEAVAGEEFAKPSEANLDATMLREGRNGYKIHPLKADGTADLKKELQFTRVTTYIDNLEDRYNLEQWKLRTLLEGAMLTAYGETDADRRDVLGEVSELVHVRDMAIIKANKADRKGKLDPGELANIEHAANKAFKDAVNKMADELLELGGVHEKANRGTNLHALAELYDAEGLEPVNAMLREGTITKTDHASIVAYATAIIEAGLKPVASEVVIVDDKAKRAGRLDRIYLYKPEGKARAIRVVGDIKSGRIDYGVGKIAQQIACYADGSVYDIETGERSSHGASKSIGILVHLPQGAGTCTIYELDLNLGRKGNALSGQVRAWRNEGKQAIGRTVVDIPAAVEPKAADE